MTIEEVFKPLSYLVINEANHQYENSDVTQKVKQLAINKIKIDNEYLNNKIKAREQDNRMYNNLVGFLEKLPIISFLFGFHISKMKNEINKNIEDIALMNEEIVFISSCKVNVKQFCQTVGYIITSPEAGQVAVGFRAVKTGWEAAQKADKEVTGFFG